MLNAFIARSKPSILRRWFPLSDVHRWRLNNVKITCVDCLLIPEPFFSHDISGTNHDMWERLIICNTEADIMSRKRATNPSITSSAVACMETTSWGKCHGHHIHTVCSCAGLKCTIIVSCSGLLWIGSDYPHCIMWVQRCADGEGHDWRSHYLWEVNALLLRGISNLGASPVHVNAQFFATDWQQQKVLGEVRQRANALTAALSRLLHQGELWYTNGGLT